MSDERTPDVQNERQDRDNQQSDRGGRRGGRQDRDNNQDTSSRGPRRGGGGRRGRRRRKEDYFAANNIEPDYKDVDTLRRFLTDRAKIRPRRQTGLSSKNQRRLARQIKRARHLALLPFTDDQTRQ